jgi:hypothetical protein
VVDGSRGWVVDGSRGRLVGRSRGRLVGRSRGRLVGWSRGGCVGGFGGGLVGVVVGHSFVGHISDEARVTINTVDNTLDAAVGKLDGVLAMSLVSITLLLLLEVLVIVAVLVVHIVGKVVEGSGVGVVRVGQRVSHSHGDEGKECNEGL